MAAASEEYRAAMGELYLLRHAKAAAPEEGSTDRERPLTEKGRKAARAIGEWIKNHELRADLVLCSPAARTRETLELVLESLRGRPDVIYDPALYLADSKRLLERLRDIPDAVERVLMVGHNPGLHELAASLSDTTNGPLAGKLALGMPTATLARFEIAIDWAGLARRSARLVAFVSPKELD